MIAQLLFGGWIGLVLGMVNIPITSATWWVIAIGANVIFNYLNEKW